MFALLLALPLTLWWRMRGRRSGAIRFSSTASAARAGRSWKQRLSFLPITLRVGALILLVFALARPQKGMERVRDINQGIAIEMVVDRSGSMGAEMEFRGQRMNRLDVVKRVFEDFVMGDGNMPNYALPRVGGRHYLRVPPLPPSMLAGGTTCACPHVGGWRLLHGWACCAFYVAAVTCRGGTTFEQGMHAY